MFTIQGEEVVDNRSSILNIMTVSNERYERGKESAVKRIEYENALDKLNREMQEVIDCTNYITERYKNVKAYSLKHQEQVKDILDLSMMKAGELVPDALTEGMHISYGENNTASVVNAKGQDINLREGGAYRAVLGVLMRYASLMAQPDALKLMFFDEYFYTLSDTTAVLVRDLIESMKGDVAIISIEQNGKATDGINNKKFQFLKRADRITEVTLLEAN